MNDDWYVKRFYLARNRNIDEAFKMIVETMKWRKEMEFANMNDQRFPVEFYKIGGLFIYEPDKLGNLTVYMRVRMHRKVPELDDYSKKFVLHTLAKADKITEGSGLGIVFDLSGAGYVNLDWDYLRFLIHAGTNYFPVGVKYILVVNIPWILNTFRKLAYAMLPEFWFGLLKFAQGDEIFIYIDKENVPDYLGGTCKRNYRAYPTGSPSVFDLIQQYGYTDKDVQRIMPVYKELLDEAEQALENGDYVDPIDFFEEPPQISSTNTLNNHPSDGDIKLKKQLRIIPERYLTFFNTSPNELESTEIIIENCSSSPVAFKLQSTNPTKYIATPKVGIVLPKLSSSVRITIREDSTIDPEKDKFLILSLPIQETAMRTKDFAKLWVDRSHETAHHKLLCRRSHSRKESRRTIQEQELIETEKKIQLLERQVQRNRRFTIFLLILYAFLLSFVFLNHYDPDRLGAWRVTLNQIYEDSLLKYEQWKNS